MFISPFLIAPFHSMKERRTYVHDMRKSVGSKAEAAAAAAVKLSLPASYMKKRKNKSERNLGAVTSAYIRNIVRTIYTHMQRLYMINKKEFRVSLAKHKFPPLVQ